MSTLRNYSKILLIGLALLISGNDSVMAQNSSFPEDLTIRRQSSTNSNGSAQYLVYIPGSDPNLLRRVKTVAPDAFTSRLDSGQRVVQIGRFSNLNLAQRRVEQLQQSGLSAQVATVASKVGNPIATPIPNIPPQTEIPITLPGVPRSPTTNSSIPSTPSELPPISTFPSTSPSATLTPIPPTTSVTPLPPPPSVALDVPPSTAPSIKNRYFVIIPSTVDSVLEKARNIVPTARLTSSDRGTYIEVQGYPDRASAETLNATMRQQGLDSRVIYF